MTQAAQIIDALRSGPKMVRDLVLLTNISSPAASRACAGLVKQGVVERLNGPGGGRPVTYALVDPAAYRPHFRAEIAARAEDQYVAARKAGTSARQAAADLGLSATSAERFEIAYRAETTGGFSFDSSCPKFAMHDRHLAAVASLGRYPTMPRLADLRRAG